MKIKHWQGYGSVTAKKVASFAEQLVIMVYGNHEWGLDRSDDYYDVFNWLVRKFDKKHKSYTDINRIDFTYCDDTMIDGVPTSTAQYVIHFKD